MFALAFLNSHLRDFIALQRYDVFDTPGFRHVWAQDKVCMEDSTRSIKLLMEPKPQSINRNDACLSETIEFVQVSLKLHHMVHQTRLIVIPKLL